MAWKGIFRDIDRKAKQRAPEIREVAEKLPNLLAELRQGGATTGGPPTSWRESREKQTWRKTRGRIWTDHKLDLPARRRDLQRGPILHGGGDCASDRPTATTAR